MSEEKVVRKVDFSGVSEDEMLNELGKRFFAFVAVGVKVVAD